MDSGERRRKRRFDLQLRWNELCDKLARLEAAEVVAVQPDEKSRLQQLLSEMRDSLHRVEHELNTLEDVAERTQPGSPQTRSLLVEDAALCPYRGLESFQEKDADFFFGRTALIRTLLAKLHKRQFLAVLGASGSGKSSVVRAGLVPALRQGRLPGSAQWPVLLMLPTAHPLTELAAQLARWRQQELPDIADRLRQDVRTLHTEADKALRQADPAVRLLLIVDQGEELYTLCDDAAERQCFLDNLLHAVTVPASRVVVISVLRTDFYARTTAHPALAACCAGNQVVVTPLTESELIEAIVEPARHVGLGFDDGLVEKLCRQVLGEPGALPLLEHALKELWERRKEGRLTLRAYQDIDGVAGAVARRAEAEFSRLTLPQQRLTRRILLRLVQLGESTEDIRRRAWLADLLSGPADTAAVTAVVERLARARLLTVANSPAADAAQMQVEVVHEALIRGWPRLRRWLDEDRQMLRFRRRLDERAEEWQRLGRDPGSLLRGAQLEEAQGWALGHQETLNVLEREFIAASAVLQEQEAAERVALQQRELAHTQAIANKAQALADEQVRRAEEHRQHLAEQVQTSQRLRRLVVALAVFLLVTLLAALLAWQKEQEATQQQALAERQSRIAQSRQLAAQSAVYRQTQPQRSLLLAVEALRVTRADDSYTAAAEEALRAALAVPNGVPLLDHDGEVLAVALARNDYTLVSAGADGLLRVWDLRRPEQASVILRGHAGRVLALALGADGQTLVSAGFDGTLRVWSLQQPARAPVILSGHAGAVLAVALGTDGQTLVSGGFDSTLRVWNIRQPEQAPTVLRGHEGEVLAVALSADGQTLVSGGFDGTVRVWNRQQPEQPPTVLRGPVGAVAAVALAADGQTLVAGGADGVVRVWDVRQPLQKPLLRRGHEGDVLALALGPRGQLVTGGADGTVRLWNLAAPDSPPQVLRGHEGRVAAVTLSADGQMLVSGSADATVRVWDLNRLEQAAIMLPAHGERLLAMNLGRDGHTLAAGSFDSTVRVWDLRQPEQPPRILSGHEGWVLAVALSADGQTLVSGGFDGTVRVWDLRQSAQPPLVLRGHAGRVLALALSADGQTLVSGGFDGTVRVWSRNGAATAGQVLRGHEGRVLALVLGSDGHTLVSGSADGTVRLWDLARPTAAPLVWRGLGEVMALALSGDERTLVIGNSDGVLQVRDRMQPMQEPLRLRGRAGWLLTAMLGADGRTLVAGSNDGTVRVWDIARPAREPVVLSGHTGGVGAVALSGDGRMLTSASFDGAVRTWLMPLPELVALACELTGRNLTWEEWQRWLDNTPYQRTCDNWPIHPSVMPP